MKKVDRLKMIYEYLRDIGAIHTKLDLSKSIGFDKTNLSSAFSGNEKYLTKGLFEKICNTFHDINPDWLFTGEGDMLGHNISQKNINGDNNVMLGKHTNASLKRDKITNNQFDLRDLLNPIYQLSLSPNAITFDNPKLLNRTFFLTIKKVLIDMRSELNEKDISYVCNNLLIEVQSIDNLILTIDSITEDDKFENTLYLQYRALYYLLNSKIELINSQYIYSINRMLQPFFVRFAYKNLLTSWLGITPETFE